MKSTVYLETLIVSYLTALPSNDVRVAACQSITADWWETRRSDFDSFVSEFVIAEASRGNEEAAARRHTAIAEIPEIAVSKDVRSLAETLIRTGSIPTKAEVDAFHIAVAAVKGINYLLTWNCAQIANAVMRPMIEGACRNFGYDPPVICIPSELLEG